MSLEHNLAPHKFESLKPDNNSARPLPLDWQTYETKAREEWRELLGSDPEENQVQQFLELHPAMVPGGSGDVGPGGHHGSDLGLLFTQPALVGAGDSYVPDFMWVTRSSGLITPILIEIEKPSKLWFTKKGTPTADFSQARDQLNNWRAWFNTEGNRDIFRRKYLFTVDKYEDRPIVPQFLLVYGRESEFGPNSTHNNPKQLRFKRNSQLAADETARSFDSLSPNYNHSQSITAKLTTKGIVPFAFSPVYSTGPIPSLGIEALNSPDAAFERTVMMTEERKAYLLERWNYWSNIGRETAGASRGLMVREYGLE
ncbi:Shedu anti-phage system protein SduA domain-containing protein [Mycetocola saprophilus]|uniref:Shedu anti-phage system protein SduA domain-containing protein n=1 Tax=Mycetocola saprophilus TaxID=76636 RepID=UPI0009DECC07|nr:Shedu anti-phage system protein SduA domain-containing protein [Mycetocola saprophilus]